MPQTGSGSSVVITTTTTTASTIVSSRLIELQANYSRHENDVGVWFWFVPPRHQTFSASATEVFLAHTGAIQIRLLLLYYYYSIIIHSIVIFSITIIIIIVISMSNVTIWWHSEWHCGDDGCHHHATWSIMQSRRCRWTTSSSQSHQVITQVTWSQNI